MSKRCQAEVMQGFRTEGKCLRFFNHGMHGEHGECTESIIKQFNRKPDVMQRVRCMKRWDLNVRSLNPESRTLLSVIRDQGKS
jgi:hypothetical protein